MDLWKLTDQLDRHGAGSDVVKFEKTSGLEFSNFLCLIKLVNLAAWYESAQSREHAALRFE